MAREPIPTHAFSLVLVKSGRRFLLVHERKHGGWYIPAGRVEPGETFQHAAVRETKEEAGIDVVLEGVLRLEQRPGPGFLRLRVIFLARPADDAPPKSVADEHTLEAGWFSLEEAKRLTLRGDEVEQLLSSVLDGTAPVAPMSILGLET